MTTLATALSKALGVKEPARFEEGIVINLVARDEKGQVTKRVSNKALVENCECCGEYHAKLYDRHDMIVCKACI